MKTPQEKYENDPQYKMIVDVITQLLLNAEFTPSEVREAATLACIHFEMNSMFRFRAVPTKVKEALEIIQNFRKEESEKDEVESISNKGCDGCR